MTTPQHRFLIIADGEFGPLTSKTANSCIRYFPERIVAVLDRKQAGKTAQEVLGFGGKIPVVGDFERGLAQGKGATAVLIGIAPAGGRLPDEWKAWLRTAIERKLEIWSGLHTFIGDDPELGPLARSRGVRILDARKPPPHLPIADGRAAEVDALVVLAVGSDCNVGKMTAQLQLRDALVQRGHRTSFVATGQTGIFIEGWGIAVDAVVADFIAGAAEQLVLQGAKDKDIVLVEGQPDSSGVFGRHARTPARLLSRRADSLPSGDARLHRRLSRSRAVGEDPVVCRDDRHLRECGAAGASHEGHRDLSEHL